MNNNEESTSYKVTRENHIIIPKWTGTYYYYPTKEWVGMEGNCIHHCRFR